jgi:signal transduction histidine kinase
LVPLRQIFLPNLGAEVYPSARAPAAFGYRTVPPAALHRFRRNESWIESYGRDVALAVCLTALLVVMELMNGWVEESLPLDRMWRQFLRYWRFLSVGLLVSITLIFIGRRWLAADGRWRWIGLATLIAVATTVGWEAQMSFRAVAWPNLPPGDPYALRAMHHQLIVTSTAMAAMHEFLRRSRRASAALHDAQLQRIALDGELAEARLQVLQAQIEPHFLFNSLANLRRLMRTDEAAGRAMLNDLLRYLEIALPRMRVEQSTLGREAELVRAFLSVHQVRMGARLHVDYAIPSALAGEAMPPMMLLTLVENALKHGLGPLPEGGDIAVSAAVSGSQLQVTVADTGQGLVAGTGGGTGLANIRARLRSVYGNAATLTLSLNHPHGVIAAIALPRGNP